MKTLLISFLISIISLCSFSASAKEKSQTITVKTNIYCDHCKKCDSCAKRIYDALHEEKGIKTVKIDDKNEEITVTFAPKKTNANIIKKIISDNGFNADDVKATPENISKLDKCCQPK